MPKYILSIGEHHRGIYSVEADSLEKAIAIAKDEEQEGALEFEGSTEFVDMNFDADIFEAEGFKEVRLIA